MSSFITVGAVPDVAFDISTSGKWHGKNARNIVVMGRRATIGGPSPIAFVANVLNDLVPFATTNGKIVEMDGTEALEIVSTSANDTAGGTGVREVHITYIDALNTVGAEVTTPVTLNGTTPVALGAGVRALAIQWAEADSPVGSNGVAVGFRGLAGITNEDPNVDVWICHHPNSTPNLSEVYRCGSTLAKAYAMQYQYQDIETGNIPSHYWIAAGPFGPISGDTIEKRAYVATPQNDACTFVTANFVVPALNGTVQIEVLDTSDFATGTYVDRDTNDGVFVGGVFWDVVSIDDGTHMTVRNRGVFGAVVIVMG